MKKSSSLLLLAIAGSSFLLSACGDAGAKFTGKWRSSDSLTQQLIDDKIVIQKLRGKYAVFPENSMEDSLMYSYDSKNDQLRCNRDNMVFIIRKTKNNHLLLTVEGMPGRQLELEKAE